MQGVTNIADVNLCLAVNNRIPTCDSVNGCSTGGCLPGFALDTTTNTCIAVIIPAPTPSARLRRRNIQRRTLCPSTKETACSLSGSSKLVSLPLPTAASVRSYSCSPTLLSSLTNTNATTFLLLLKLAVLVEMLGQSLLGLSRSLLMLLNSTGAGEGCQDGECIKMD